MGKPWGRRLPLILFSLPALGTLGLFVLYPFLDVLRFSTWEWSGLSEPKPVGLKNYAHLLQDPAFWGSLWVTLKFMLLALPLFVGLSVALALALEGAPYERLAKSLLFLPGLVTLGGATLSWYTLFTPEYGALAQFLPVPPWDREGFWALAVVVLFTLWRHLGYGVLVASARLKAIPKTLLEAAYVDGAGPFEAFRYVTLPLLKPALAFLVVVGTVLALQSYSAVFLLTRGGPFGATRVLGYYLYEAGFENFRLGYAAAVTVVILLLTLFFAYAQLRLLRSED
ncbi:permease component of ABC-type sugar transporter [Thermus oshimai JL-2]|uniref:Permease component of ABC-type sugar transporter n=1 Tax=Thermus oshimai JL-2 TaxID=751945 RepID=K7QXN0_THEOS|nr:sugar ABC transporter permease [Thermus oshimai]AFV75205.1 permease component of ABC-type sugar transporter [Thermus oshimai JL-2]